MLTDVFLTPSQAERTDGNMCLEDGDGLLGRIVSWI